MENKIRNTLNEIYFSKTKDIVNSLRSVQPLTERNQQQALKQDLAAALQRRHNKSENNWCLQVYEINYQEDEWLWFQSSVYLYFEDCYFLIFLLLLWRVLLYLIAFYLYLRKLNRVRNLYISRKEREWLWQIHYSLIKVRFIKTSSFIRYLPLYFPQQSRYTSKKYSFAKQNRW